MINSMKQLNRAKSNKTLSKSSILPYLFIFLHFQKMIEQNEYSFKI